MKLINKILLLIVLILSIIPAIKAQETMYIYKNGVIVGEHDLAEVDSVIFYKPTQGMLVDIDGNEYKTVVIGTQNWMAENLKTTTYNDGTPISLVTDNTVWSNLTIGCYCLNDFAGATYNYYTVETDKLCPDGWHVPTDVDWNVLENFLATQGNAGTEATVLKATSGWYMGGNGTDYYDFSAIPGGNCGSGNDQYGKWWSSSDDGNIAYLRKMIYTEQDIWHSSDSKSSKASVRCLKD